MEHNRIELPVSFETLAQGPLERVGRSAKVSSAEDIRV